MSAVPVFAGYLEAAVPAADNPRKAALLLHSLPAPDRDWLLAQLAPAQRQGVQRLLDELQELGIPAEPQLLDEVVGPGAPVAADPEAAQVDRVQRADPAAVAAWLQREPVGLVVRVLRLHDWRWTHEVLRQMGELRRREVQAVLAGVPPRAPLRTRGDAQLLALLVQRLERTPGAPVLAPPAAWRRWLPRGMKR
jgi:hypothetical protein